LYNDLFWENRSYKIGVGHLGLGTQNQQNVVALYNATFTRSGTGAQAPSQPSTGYCVAGSSYWDIGVRGDTGPTNHTGGTLSPTYSFLTSLPAPYNSAGVHNSSADPAVVSQYCNGSRMPPEAGMGAGWQVPPGIADATVPNPIFHLTPSATVDEGNNWINISWGPLAMTNAQTNATLGNYTPNTGAPTINYIPLAGNNGVGGAYALAPLTDFFGTSRKTNNAVDAGAVEFVAAGAGVPAAASLTPTSWTPTTNRGCTLFGPNACPTQQFTLRNTGTVTLTGITTGSITGASEFSVLVLGSTWGTVLAQSLAPGASCTITARFAPPSGDTTGTKNATLSVTDAAGTQMSTLTGTAN